MIEFNQITVFKNSYIKVISLKVEVPLRNNEESFCFISFNRHLIYLAIDQSEIQKHIPWDKWETTLQRIFWREPNIKKINLDQFQDWQVSCVKFTFHKYQKCSKDEIKSYSFMRYNQVEEILSGNLKYIYNEYKHTLYLKENNYVTKNYLLNKSRI